MSLTRAAIRRPVTTVAAVLALVLVGSVSLSRLPVSLLPDVTLPLLTIRTDYEGAAATEVSRFVAELPYPASERNTNLVRRIKGILGSTGSLAPLIRDLRGIGNTPSPWPNHDEVYGSARGNREIQFERSTASSNIEALGNVDAVYPHRIATTVVGLHYVPNAFPKFDRPGLQRRCRRIRSQFSTREAGDTRHA